MANHSQVSERTHRGVSLPPAVHTTPAGPAHCPQAPPTCNPALLWRVPLQCCPSSSHRPRPLTAPPSLSQPRPTGPALHSKPRPTPPFSLAAPPTGPALLSRSPALPQPRPPPAGSPPTIPPSPRARGTPCTGLAGGPRAKAHSRVPGPRL